MKITWKSSVWMFLITTFLVVPFHKFQEADKRKTTQEKFDYINQNRPYLESELVIDKIISNSIPSAPGFSTNGIVYYHFDIHNTGVLPASSIFAEQKSESFVTHDFPDENRYLAPGAKMSIEVMPAIITSGMFLDLNLKYQGAYQGTNLEFTSVFRFKIPMGAIKVGAFYYQENEPELNTNLIGGTNLLATYYESILDVPSNSFVIAGRKDQMDLVVMSGTNRAFLFDRQSRTVFFKTTRSDGKAMVFVDEIPMTPNGFHFVSAHWTPIDAGLWIDTNSNVPESSPTK